MRISEIWIKNFRGYGENPDEEEGFYKFVNLDKPDIVLLTGHNGYGKTSFYEAIEWCFTDDIRAIKKMTEDANQKNTLKKSHYLKFQSTYDDRDREIIVKVAFNDGSSLMRKTKYDSLHDDKYKSEIHCEGGYQGGSGDVSEFIKEKIGQREDQFFRLNFCGQAFSGDLVRDTSAKNRGKILSGFLGMDDIGKIRELSAPKQNPVLGKKLTDIKEKIEENGKIKESLDAIFRINQWGSITNYQKLVSVEMETANAMCQALKKANIAVDFCFKKDTIPDIVSSLEQLRVSKERLGRFIEQDQKLKISLIKSHLIKKYRDNQIFLRDAELVEQSDIIKLREDFVKYTEKENAYKDIIEDLEKKRIVLESKEISVQSNKKVVYLSENMAHEFEKRRELLKNLYLEGEKYGLKLKREKKWINVGRLLYYTAIHRNWIKTSLVVLEEKEKTLKMVMGIQDSQIEMLLKVQEYVNTRNLLEECPVCGGTEFYIGEKDAKAKLLSIIGKTISDGNEAISACNEEISLRRSWMHRVEESYKKWVWDKFTSEMKELEQEINQCIQIISEKLEQIIKCNDKMRNSIRIRREKTEEKVSTYDAFVQKYGMEKETLDLNIVNARKADQWIRSILIKRFQVQADDVEVLEGGEVKGFRQLIKKIYLEKKALDTVLSILKYDLGKENLDLLQRYVIADTETSKLEKKKKLYEEAYVFREKVNKVAREIEKDMIKKYIMDNKMINLIFEFINPHPFYRQFRIVKSGAETNMIPVGKGEADIYLDHLFSEAQLRVLSLSIFLGLSLSAKDNDFGQIYIDDPVQSMDDINMVSFIDLLRALKRSDRVDKNLIIGTHDLNFSKLLKIKFRHHSYVEYYFDSYTREGPKVVRRQNGRK